MRDYQHRILQPRVDDSIVQVRLGSHRHAFLDLEL
jgi:hypothetical protein